MKLLLRWFALLVGGGITGCATFVCERDARVELCYHPEQQPRPRLEERERALTRVEAFFGRQAPGAVRVLVFPTYDDGVGTASPERRTAYVALQAGTWAYERHNAGHELTHIFSNTDSQWRTVHVVGLLDEGLAEYLGGSELDPHLRLTEHMQASGNSKSDMRIESRNLNYKSPSLYPLGGSFVKFLVEAQPNGREKLLKLLDRTRLAKADAEPSFLAFTDALETTFEKPYAQLMEEWNRALLPYWEQRFPLGSDDRTRLEELLRSNRFKTVHYFGFYRFLRLVVTLDDGRSVTVEAKSDDSWRVVKGP